MQQKWATYSATDFGGSRHYKHRILIRFYNWARLAEKNTLSCRYICTDMLLEQFLKGKR